MRVLLIEDNCTTSKCIELVLTQEGIICDVVDLGEDGIQICKVYEFDLIILDLHLPDIDGHEVLRRLRSAAVKVPVLILSAVNKTEDKIKGLKAGADDFLSKPCDNKELLARIQAIIRRTKGHPESTIKIGELEINLETKRVSIKGVTINLTCKEYAMIEFFCLKKGTILPKDTILNHLYGGIDEPDLKIIDVFVCKARKKLDQAAEKVGAQGGFIETVWGRGYVMKDIPPVTNTSEYSDSATFSELDGSNV